VRKPKQKLIIEVEVEAVHISATGTMVDLMISDHVANANPDVRFSIDDSRLCWIEHECASASEGE